jgi:hyperosmotically inducible protein
MQRSESIDRLHEAEVVHSPEVGLNANQRTNMKTTKLLFTVLSLLAIGTMVGCRHEPAKSPDVASSIRKSLDQAGLTSVSVSQDRDKGVVTLGGQVGSDAQKIQAESLANSLAGGQVVADQIAVVFAGQEKESKAMNSDLDQGIEKNLDAALILNKMHHSVNYSVKNGVVTLTGEVGSEARRTAAQNVAFGVPYVRQVVNDLQVKNQKASSSQNPSQ